VTVYTHQATRVRPPSVAAIVAWLWRWLLDAVTATFTHPAAGRHAPAVVRRAECGLDEQWPVDLADMRVELADTEVIPVVVEAPPRTGWVLEGTQPFTESDRLDFDRTYAATFGFANTDVADTLRRIHGWPDATEVALTAAARQQL
jgi:hypothetical protein